MATITQTIAPLETVQMKLQTQWTHSPQPPTGMKPKAKLRLDPQRALEPARKKLSTLESQRIMAVLVDSIRKTELVTVLPKILADLDRYKVVLGTDLVRMLEEHKAILESFAELKQATDDILDNDARVREERKEQLAQQKTQDEEEEQEEEYEEYEEEEEDRSRPPSTTSISSQAEMAMHHLSLVARQMQFSCKNILRGFALNPSAMNAVLKQQPEPRSHNSGEMISDMNELKDIIMGMLLTTPVEETERNQYLKQVTQRERQNAVVIEKLEAELAAAMADKDEEIRKKNDVIRRLQAELHQIQKFSEENIRRIKGDAEKQVAADSKNSEGKSTKLQQELLLLKTQMQSLIQEHRESESALRKKKWRIETEVENWIQKYDGDMGERQDEYEEIDAVYTEEKKQLNELEERFKTLEAEYNQITAERRIAQERREARERELQMSVKAATVIQAFWRSYRVRKALKSKKKKKGGKKKKVPTATLR